MTDVGHIGLNEVALGIPVPVYWAKLMGRVIGEGPAHHLCLTATLVSPQKALQLGLVDQVMILLSNVAEPRLRTECCRLKSCPSSSVKVERDL